MYDTTIAAKLLKQLESFFGEDFSPFPQARGPVHRRHDVRHHGGEGRGALVHSPRAQGGNHPEKGRGQAQQDKGEVGDNLGYWGCMAVACDSGGRRPIPLHFRLWSADSPGFVSENDVPEFHFYAIADAASDVLKRGRRWRGFDPAAAEARDAASLFEFFGLNTG